MNIKKIIINGKEYDFKEKNLIYIYGANNKGKTYLYNIIDAFLGASKSLDKIKKDKNIKLNNIKMEVEINNKNLLLEIRNNDSELNYYINNRKIGKDDYKERINTSIFKNIDFSMISKEINYTYRQAAILNFFPEIHIGELSCIFPKDMNKYRKTTNKEDVINLLLGIFSPEDIINKQFNKEIKRVKERKQKIETKKTKLEEEINATNKGDNDDIEEYIRLSNDIKILNSKKGKKIEKRIEILELFKNTNIPEKEIEKITKMIENIEYQLQIKSIINEKILEKKEKIKKIQTTDIEKKAKLKLLEEELLEFNDNSPKQINSNEKIKLELKQTFCQYKSDLSHYIDIGNNTVKVDYDNFIIEYNGGSLAIKTMLQLIFVFSIHDMLNKNKKDHIPLIILDAYSQPFDSDQNKFFINDLIMLFVSKEYNKETQIICLESKPEGDFIKKEDKNKFTIINISKGLI